MPRKTLFYLAFGILTAFLAGIVTARLKILPYPLSKGPPKKSTSGTARVNYFSRPPKTDHSNYYLDKQSFFRQHGQTYDVVMIGDSITDGAEWEALFPSINIANRGIFGDTTTGLLARLNSITSTQAHKAFIMIGINDFSRGATVPEVYENYKNIVMHLKQKEMLIYIQSTILGGARKADVNPKILALNEELKTFAIATEGVTYIDLNKGLAPNGSLDPQFSRDEVHLNGEGYAVWRDLIQPQILNNG